MLLMNHKAKFIEVVCMRCGNTQIVFGKASTRVKCLNCNKLLLQNNGGKSRIKTFVREVLDGNQ